MEDLLFFLKELKLNNNREWFNDNKTRYLKVKAIFEDFIQNIIYGIVRFDSSIASIQVKDCIFRIYRDTRFSHDKTPYKTHTGAFIVKGGKTNPRGGYYVHIEPGSSLLSGGIWCPSPEILKALRSDIYYNAEEFLEIMGNPELTKHYIYDDEKLTKVPPSFPSDSPVSEWLKNKRFCPVSYVSDDFFTGNDAAERCVERLKLLYPLNSFINNSVGNNN